MMMFSDAVYSAARNDMQARANFFNEMAHSALRGAQKISELEVQLAERISDETMSCVQSMLTSRKADAPVTASLSNVQPVVSAYLDFQERVLRAGIEVQNDLAQIGGRHAPETARTGTALCEAIQQDITRQSEERLRQNKEMGERVSNAMVQGAQATEQQHQAARQPDVDIKAPGTTTVPASAHEKGQRHGAGQQAH